jgi:hypothetical protein
LASILFSLFYAWAAHLPRLKLPLHEPELCIELMKDSEKHNYGDQSLWLLFFFFILCLSCSSPLPQTATSKPELRVELMKDSEKHNYWDQSLFLLFFFPYSMHELFNVHLPCLNLPLHEPELCLELMKDSEKIITVTSHFGFYSFFFILCLSCSSPLPQTATSIELMKDSKKYYGDQTLWLLSISLFYAWAVHLPRLKLPLHEPELCLELMKDSEKHNCRNQLLWLLFFFFILRASCSSPPPQTANSWAQFVFRTHERFRYIITETKRFGFYLFLYSMPELFISLASNCHF